MLGTAVLACCLSTVQSWISQPLCTRRTHLALRRSASVTSLALPTAGAAASLFLAEHRTLSTFALASTRGMIGDLIAQSMEGKTSINRRRLFIYIGWCNFVAFCYSYPIYAIYIPRWLPSIVGGGICWGNVVLATLADNLLCSPFMYYPLFYLWKDLMNGIFDPVASLMQYRRESWQQLRALWSFYFPVNFVMHAFVPLHCRVAYTAILGTIWVVILSRTTSHLPITNTGD